MKKLIYNKEKDAEAIIFTSKKHLLDLMGRSRHVFVKDKFDEFYYMVYNNDNKGEEFTLLAKDCLNSLIDMNLSFDKLLEDYQIYIASEADLLEFFEKSAK